jgi:hypothetical protein
MFDFENVRGLNPPPVWNYVLNYTAPDGTTCDTLYGGATLEESMRNATKGLWLKHQGPYSNCAYYMVVGNNLPNDPVNFYFTRTSAVITLLSIFSMISLTFGFQLI